MYKLAGGYPSAEWAEMVTDADGIEHADCGFLNNVTKLPNIKQTAALERYLFVFITNAKTSGNHYNESPSLHLLWWNSLTLAKHLRHALT